MSVEHDPGQSPEQSRIGAAIDGVKEAFASTVDYLEGKTAVGLIALTGLTGAGVAVASQANTEPAQAANVPEATASDQTQDCVDAALDDPLGVHTHMSFTGAAHSQTVSEWLRFTPTSAACAPLVSRQTPQAFVKMQNPKNHSKLIKTQKKELLQGTDSLGHPVPMDANGGKLGEVSFNRKDGDKLRYRCTPGKDVTRMWVTLIVEADSVVDGSTLGRRSFTKPVKIPHKPRRLLRDHELPGPC